MTDFETPCLCLARDARTQEPERYRWKGNVLWGIWQACPTHHEHFMSPVWTARLGQLKDETDANQAPVEVRA